jgi:hypothetical protein
MIQKVPHPARWAAARAMITVRQGHQTSRWAMSQAEFSRWLLHYADVLESHPVCQKGPFMHRFQLGPLLFAGPLDRRSRLADDIETGLLFGLTLLSREFSAPECESVQLPVMMPRGGDPRWPIAVAALSDALDIHLDEKAAQTRVCKLLERHPDLGWMGWPDVPWTFFESPGLAEWFPDSPIVRRWRQDDERRTGGKAA